MRAALAAACGLAALLLLGTAPSQTAAVATRASGTGFAAIVTGAVVTQGFGCTPFALEPVSSLCASGHFHSGIDLAAASGTPVFAAASGVASVVESATGYGLHVLLRHASTGVTLYGHLSRALVRSGQSVAAGQEIGLLGSSGMSTGPHVHFEIRQAGAPVDPVAWLPVLQGSSTRTRPD